MISIRNSKKRSSLSNHYEPRMKVLFLQNIRNVAQIGDIKDVADGYARNFLLPRKLAVLSTANTLKMAEQLKQKRALEAQKEEGIIKKFTIDVDNSKIGKGLAVYVLITADLQVLKSKNKTQYDLAKELRKFDFVERADIVSGGPDLVALIRVKDVEEFDKVLL